MLTVQQSAAVAARGKILVSASAGAGKTTVMIKRLADILCGGVDLDNVLAVTFTKKAAAQMKEKLRSELVSRLSSCGGAERENIRIQLGKINSADISTIDSFCARLVRTYFYAFDGVDASFEIAADETEVKKLQARAMDNLFERLYGSEDCPPDENFLYLLDRLKKNRKDANVREAVIKAYARLRIEPGYTRIAQKCARTFSEGGFEEVCAQLGALAGERCAFYADKAEEFFKTLAFNSGGEAYGAMLAEICGNLRRVARERDIFARPLKLASSPKPRKKEENASEDARFAAFVNGVKRRYENLFKGIGGEEDERRAFEESGRLARIFADVVLQFDGEYTAVKREESKLDYQDLEHLAYALVCGDSAADKDIKEQINGKYKYVFIDEYQDVNPIQDAIINAVAGGDLFKVGDVKQAIYGFRGSRSHFFSGQLESAAESGSCVILPHNFRSSEAVIDFVNGAFSHIMTPVLCGFDYLSGGHAMISGNAPSEGRGFAGICFFDDGCGEKKEADGVYSVESDSPENAPAGPEARAIVGLVDELLRSTVYDSDSGTSRPVQQGDICILTRKKGAKGVNEARRELIARGYRVDGTAESNVCDIPEIKRLIGILSYIDNSEQDVALVSALLSPLGGLTEDELAAVRLGGGTGINAPSFRRCAEKYALGSDPLAGKLRAFYAAAGRLKRLSDVLGAARLIDEILKLEGFTAQFPQGEKLSALRRLQAEAGADAGELSLNAFLNKLKASGYKVALPVPLASDSIKIMTMHASKGLEFPIVIISDIAAGFGGDDREDISYDEQYGFAPRFYDPEKRVYGDTLLRRLFRMRASAEELKNEINLFYVACTRARYGLYVVCAERGAADPTGAPTASCYADLLDDKWLENAVTRHISPDEWVVAPTEDNGGAAIGSFAKDEALYAELEKSFMFVPAEEGAELPVKSSATKILGLTAEDEVYPVMFAGDEGDTDIESGLAYHAFLQFCDFSVKDKEGIAAELARFSADGLIPPERIALLDVARLQNILALPRFGGLAGYRVYREREFLCSLSAAEYGALCRGESPFDEKAGKEGGQSVIIQGAIDLLAVRLDEGGAAVGADIIDYKYSARKDWALEKKYAPQLALYKKAVARAYGLPADKITTTIINIRACTEIPVII